MSALATGNAAWKEKRDEGLHQASKTVLVSVLRRVPEGGSHQEQANTNRAPSLVGSVEGGGVCDCQYLKRASAVDHELPLWVSEH